MPDFESTDIRRYYDRHTPSFLRLGQGGTVGAIHRAVWGPGVTTRTAAFRHVEDLIAALVHRDLTTGTDSPHLVDLGCGVGGSLCYLASLLPIRGTGITLSPVQACLARQRIEAARLSARLTCLEGDYTSLPDAVDRAHLVYAIESFVHGSCPQRFFTECHRLLLPGGLLVICDDFDRHTTGEAAARTVEQFRRGWYVNTLISRDRAIGMASASGFALESVTTLTPWLELGRVRDRIVSAASTLMTVMSRGLPAGLRERFRAGVTRRYGPLIGGSALQTCLAEGWIDYEFLVFRRER